MKLTRVLLATGSVDCFSSVGLGRCSIISAMVSGIYFGIRAAVSSSMSQPNPGISYVWLRLF